MTPDPTDEQTTGATSTTPHDTTPHDTTHVPTRSAKWNQRRARIIDRSASLMADRGYHATSTSELCEANGLGKGALYYYIGSKEQLLLAIHDRVLDEVLAGAERVDAEGGSPSEQLRKLGAELIEVITRYPDHVWVLLHDFPALTGDPATAVRARWRRYEEQVERIIAEGSASGEFRPADARLTARAWFGMHNYTYLWLRTSRGDDAAEVASWFADLFIDGLASGRPARDHEGATA